VKTVSALALGAQTPFGEIVAIGWVGERYYWCIDASGVVSMMPASLIEVP
jgi:hypothetical protein